MKNLKIFAVALISLFFISACEDSNGPTENPEVEIIGEMATRYVTMIQKEKTTNKLLSNEVDSIRIIRIRILMSRLMLFPENSSSSTGVIFKSDPFVYDLSVSAGEAVLGKSDVPEGIYEKVKLEIHRFSTSELSQYTNDQIFKDFASSDRYTILIEGISYLNGNPSTFTFKSNAVANLALVLEPKLNMKNNTNTKIILQVDPNFFFKKWESILDPNDSKNTTDIENAIINTIKALKK